MIPSYSQATQRPNAEGRDPSPRPKAELSTLSVSFSTVLDSRRTGSMGELRAQAGSPSTCQELSVQRVGT